VTLRGRATLLAVALILTSCAGSPPPSATPDDTDAPAPAASTTTTTAPLAAPARYQPAAGEPVPEVKQLAADVVQALATYGPSPAPLDQARRRLTGLSVRGDLAASAGPLLAPGVEAATDIVYPQLGGLTATTASVMVVARQRQRNDARAVESTVTRTIDVRLARTPATAWVVTALASVGGEPPAVPPTASEAAEAVLSSTNLDIPDSARWDIQAGMVDARVLSLLAELARTHQLSVTVLATGHPANVFATRKVSNHTVGRAVDVWGFNGRPVIDQRQTDGPLASLARALLTQGVTELGGPWDLDGPGGASFANTVHQDHLHLGFDA